MTVLGSRYSLRVGNATRCRLLAKLMKHGESNAVVESEYSTSGTCVSVFLGSLPLPIVRVPHPCLYHVPPPPTCSDMKFCPPELDSTISLPDLARSS